MSLALRVINYVTETKRTSDPLRGKLLWVKTVEGVCTTEQGEQSIKGMLFSHKCDAIALGTMVMSASVYHGSKYYNVYRVNKDSMYPCLMTSDLDDLWYTRVWGIFEEKQLSAKNRALAQFTNEELIAELNNRGVKWT